MSLETESVRRCAGCSYRHSYCTSQTRVEDLLHQLYGAAKNEVGLSEALSDVELWLS